jgi:DNA-binding transcriptional regulator YiaG
MKQKFTSELQQTYKSIEQNKWLAVAQFLRRSVKNIRDLENLSTRPFTEWIGIPKELTQLSLGL